MNDGLITYKEVCELLEYNPETGVIKWLKNRINGARKNDVAGSAIQGYIRICINGNTYGAHRLTWLLVMQEWPKGQIDHKDRVRNNNVFSNLRDVTRIENAKNSPLRIDNTSGVCGVSWNKKNCKWIARVHINRKPVGLGSYVDKFEAICARMSANNKYSFHANHGR